MKKIATGFYQFEERLEPTENVSLQMTVDLIDGEELDTQVKMEGIIAVPGKFRKEFSDKLGALIDQYRI